MNNQLEPFWSPYTHFKTCITSIFDLILSLNISPIERKEPRRNDSYQSYFNRARTQHEQYIPIILEAASRYRVDPAIILAMIKTESNYNPYAISKAGAVGLMQLMPKTARELGVRNSYNPEQNIHGGVKYFSQLLNKFNGNQALALAAYNAGSRKVLEYKGIPPHKETRKYIKKVFKYREQYKQEIIGG